MQEIKSFLIGWEQTNDLAHSFMEFLGAPLHNPLDYIHICQSLTMKIEFILLYEYFIFSCYNFYTFTESLNTNSNFETKRPRV